MQGVQDLNKAAQQLASTLSKIADLGSKGAKLAQLETTGQQTAASGGTSSQGGLGLGSVAGKLLGASVALIGAAKFLSGTPGVNSNVGSLNDLASTGVWDIVAATIASGIEDIFGKGAIQTAFQSFVTAVGDVTKAFASFLAYTNGIGQKAADAAQPAVDAVVDALGPYHGAITEEEMAASRARAARNSTGVDKGPQ